MLFLLLLLSTYQLNSTVHGTMKKPPYELAFGQPPRQNFFLGIERTDIMEEDVGDLLMEEEQMDGIGVESARGSNEETNDTEDGIGADNTGSASIVGGNTSGDERTLESTDDMTSQPSSRLGTSEKHLMTRAEADKCYHQNAERMRLKYCKQKRKKVMTFTAGEYVSVKIPRIDRTSTDFHRLPCVVVERLGSKYHLYRLRYIRLCGHGCG